MFAAKNFFLASAIVPTPTVEYLVVAGGGDDSNNGAGCGGGGAGGFRTATSFAVTAGTSYTITV